MSLQIIFKCLSLLLFSACVFAGEEPVIGQELTLKAATEQAVQDNPDLAQMQARAQAMAAIPSQMGALPDPEISFNAMSLPVNTFNTKQEDMTQLGAGISLAIPFPGKLALREQAAAFEAEAASQSVAEVRLRLLSEVKTTWWLIFYLDRAIQIVDSNHALLQQFVQPVGLYQNLRDGGSGNIDDYAGAGIDRLFCSRQDHPGTKKSD